MNRSRIRNSLCEFFFFKISFNICPRRRFRFRGQLFMLERDLSSDMASELMFGRRKLAHALDDRCLLEECLNTLSFVCIYFNTVAFLLLFSTKCSKLGLYIHKRKPFTNRQLKITILSLLHFLENFQKKLVTRKTLLRMYTALKNCSVFRLYLCSSNGRMRNPATNMGFLKTLRGLQPLMEWMYVIGPRSAGWLVNQVGLNKGRVGAMKIKGVSDH